MWLPPIMGTRKLVTLTTALLLIPLIGWGIAVQNPSTTFTTFMILAFLSGIGGGAFSGFMPSTSYFFPRRKQGTRARPAGRHRQLRRLHRPVRDAVDHRLLAARRPRCVADVPRPGEEHQPRGLVPERRLHLRAVRHRRRGARLDDAQERPGARQLPPAARHLQQHRHLVDDRALRHDLRHVRRPLGAVRAAHQEPLRRGQHRRSSRPPPTARPRCSCRATPFPSR